MTPFELYLWLTLPAVGNAAGVALGIGTLVAIIFAGVSALYYIEEGEDPQVLKYCKRSLAVAVLCASGCVATSIVPDRKTVLTVVGWKVGASIEGLSEVPSDIVEYIRELLAKELAELREGEDDE